MGLRGVAIILCRADWLGLSLSIESRHGNNRHLGANTGYTLNHIHLNTYNHTLLSTGKCRVVALCVLEVGVKLYR